MSRLSAFLHPVQAEQEREIVISKRFQDENGSPAPFKVRAITQEENAAITKRATKMRRVNGQMQEYIDPSELSARMVVAATVEPDFSSKEICDAYGVMDPLLVPGKMLLSGEYARLLQEISELSGFKSAEELEEQAKN